MKDFLSLEFTIDEKKVWQEIVDKERKAFAESINEAIREKEERRYKLRHEEILKLAEEDAKKKIYEQRDEGNTELIEGVDRFEEIPSNNIKERSEIIHQELMKIREN
jgi:hypothetical protein